MHVTEIVVNAGRTFNHPHESFSNLRPSVTLKASITEDEDAEGCVQRLQVTAEKLVEDHKRHLLDSIEELEQMQRAQREIADLGDSIGRQQERLEQMRKQWPELPVWLSLEKEPIGQ